MFFHDFKFSNQFDTKCDSGILPTAEDLLAEYQFQRKSKQPVCHAFQAMSSMPQLVFRDRSACRTMYGLHHTLLPQDWLTEMQECVNAISGRSDEVCRVYLHLCRSFLNLSKRRQAELCGTAVDELVRPSQVPISFQFGHEKNVGFVSIYGKKIECEALYRNDDGVSWYTIKKSCVPKLIVGGCYPASKMFHEVSEWAESEI